MNNINISLISGKADDAFLGRIDTHGFILVGVPRNKIAQACNCNEIPPQGIYFLVNTKETKYKQRYLYVGQTKTGPNRLQDHKSKKAEWDMAYMFLGHKYLFSLQVIDELESLEIEKYKNNKAFNLVNEKPNRAIPGVETQNIANIIEEVMTFLGYGFDYSLSTLEEVGEEEKEHDNLLNVDNCGDLSYMKPVYCRFRKNEYDMANSKEYIGFKGLLKIVGLELDKIKHKELQTLADRKMGRGPKAKKPSISNSADELRSPIFISDSIFIEGNISHNDACKMIRLLFEECSVNISDFAFSIAKEWRDIND